MFESNQIWQKLIMGQIKHCVTHNSSLNQINVYWCVYLYFHNLSSQIKTQIPFNDHNVLEIQEKSEQFSSDNEDVLIDIPNKTKTLNVNVNLLNVYM